MQPSARHWAAIVNFSNDLTGTLYFIGRYTMITSKDRFKDKKLLFRLFIIDFWERIIYLSACFYFSSPFVTSQVVSFGRCEVELKRKCNCDQIVGQ